MPLWPCPVGRNFILFESLKPPGLSSALEGMAERYISKSYKESAGVFLLTALPDGRVPPPSSNR